MDAAMEPGRVENVRDASHAGGGDSETRRRSRSRDRNGGAGPRHGEAPGKVRLTVMSMAGNTMAVLSADRTDYVSVVLQHLEDLCGLSSGRQKLVFRSRVLQERLSLAENGLPDEAEVHLVRGQDGLQKLFLGSNMLGPAGVEALASDIPDVNALREVELSACELWGAVGGRAVAALTWKTVALEKLVLVSNEDLAPAGVLALAKDLPAGNTLTTVELATCGLKGPAGGRALAVLLHSAPLLRQLVVANNQLGSSGVTALAKGMPAHRALKELDMELCGLGTAAGGRAVAMVARKAAALEQLFLAESAGLGPDGVGALARALPDTTVLKNIDLRQCGLAGSEGGRAVGALARKATTLECLDLSSNILGSAGGERDRAEPPGGQQARAGPAGRLQALGAHGRTLARGATSLTKLVLNGNRLGPEGVDALAQALQGSANSLKDLYITSCSLDGAEGGRAVALLSSTSPGLEMLVLEDNEFRQAGMRALVRGLPAITQFKEVFLCTAGLEGRGAGKATAALARKAPGLEKLVLGGNHRFGPAGLQALAQGLGEGSRLKDIGLQECGLRKASGGQAIAALVSSARGCERVWLEGNPGLGAAGVQALASGLPASNTLLEAGLQACQVQGQPGGSALASLARSTSKLEKLNMSVDMDQAEDIIFDGELSVDGLQAFCHELPEAGHSALKELHLSANGFRGAECGRTLAAVVRKLASLEVLACDDNDMGDEGVSLLARGLPEDGSSSLRTVSLQEVGLQGPSGGRAAAQLVAALSR
eukprot:CAMPEP_0179373948 /NCGR_PEP_ID=MMETSP0797-20121207/87054_1 /TAXON_ID=47934 /ORGANISM="Dinophysis acuminata, Strain DAEP01" /LENGTH=768 /DNA_ID=CAMNT_0021089947 /DNA_START=17 /DNA_END=2322 /DNA_ORIENTATION=+